MFSLKRAALAALMVCTPCLARAQQPAAPKLEVGTWTGVVVPPNGESTDVTYAVSSKNDTLAITVDVGPHGSFAFQQIKLEGDKLSFSFTPGPTVQCVLTRNAQGGYEGDCLDDGGSAAHMMMVPPKKQTPSGS